MENLISPPFSCGAPSAGTHQQRAQGADFCIRGVSQIVHRVVCAACVRVKMHVCDVENVTTHMAYIVV
eukprot:6189049-Pyramimonas_sp.AAC.1